MLGIVRSWFDRLFAEEETVVLLLLIGACFLLMVTLGNVLVPIVTSIVLAFMMQGIIARLSNMGMSRWLTIAITYLVFVSIFFGVLVVLLPLVWQQLTNLFQELPAMLRKLQQLFLLLPQLSEMFTDH